MTSFGINNNGHLVFDYYHEDYGDNSVSGQLDVYNGKDSVLWVNFSQAFADDIKHTYQSWRGGSNPLLSYDKVVENFITNHSDQWSISIYNEDAEYKYISMYRNGELKGDQYLYQVRGTGEEHLKYFIKNRLMYCDSKWQAGDFINKDTNTVILRINAPDISASYPKLQPSTKIKYTTFSNMYAGVGYGAKAGVTHWAYTKKGEPVWFERNEGGQNDLDTYIFGASEISSLDDLSLLYCGDINVSAASKLTKLIVGSTEQGYTNENLKSLSLSNNRLLREINVCNCTELKTTLDFSLCPDIQEIYAQGSGITGVILPTSGFLKKMHLPRVNEIIITNQNRIEEFTCEGYNNLSTLKIENSTMVVKKQDGTIVSTERFPLQEILLGCDINLMATINIKNVKWDVDSETNLRTIINKLTQKQGFVLEGSVYVLNGATISDDLKVLIHQHFPKLNVIDNDPIFYIDYYKYDGGLWDTEPVRQGHNAVGPSKGNPPHVTMDEQGERHLFVEWNNLPTNVQQNCSVNAKWQTKYAVSFYNEDGTSIYHRDWYNVDEIPEDPLLANKIYEPTKASGTPDSLKYKFNGWATSPNSTESLSTLPVLKGVTDFYATFIEQYAVKFNKTSENDSKQEQYGETQWIVKGQNATRPAINPTKASTAEFEYTFDKWVGDYTNVTSARTIYASYTSTKRQYKVSFYNFEEGVKEHWLYDHPTLVTYGNSATDPVETGKIDTPQKLGVDDPTQYEFTGWNPSYKNITGETKCYATFRYKGYISDSWATIAANVANGTATSLYPIGARKDITVTLSDGVTYNIDVEVIAHNHDNRSDGNGKAGLTFFCKYLPAFTRRMYNSQVNTDGWPQSDMRSFVNGELFNAFPEELKNAIKEVDKISDGGQNYRGLMTTQDKCWIPSYEEVGCVVNESNTVPGQGEIYSQTFGYGPEGNSTRVRYMINNNATDGKWWLRTTLYDTSVKFWRIAVSNMAGQAYSGAMWDSNPVAFGFCI